MLLARDDSVQLANPLPERIPTEIEILRRELEVERRRNMDLDHQYQTDLGQSRYFLKIKEDKVKDERKKREERARVAARGLQEFGSQKQKVRG